MKYSLTLIVGSLCLASVSLAHRRPHRRVQGHHYNRHHHGHHHKAVNPWPYSTATASASTTAYTAEPTADYDSPFETPVQTYVSEPAQTVAPEPEPVYYPEATTTPLPDITTPYSEPAAGQTDTPVYGLSNGLSPVDCVPVTTTVYVTVPTSQPTQGAATPVYQDYPVVTPTQTVPVPQETDDVPEGYVRKTKTICDVCDATSIPLAMTTTVPATVASTPTGLSGVEGHLRRHKHHHHHHHHHEHKSKHHHHHHHDKSSAETGSAKVSPFLA